MTLRPPAGTSSLRSTGLLLAALVVPTALALALADEEGLAEVLPAAGTVLLTLGAVISCGLLLGHARLAGNEQTLWFGTAMAAIALTALVRSAVSLTHPVSAMPPPEAVMAGLIPLLGSFAVVFVVARSSSRLRPLAVGLPLVVVTLVAQQVVRAVDPGIDS